MDRMSEESGPADAQRSCPHCGAMVAANKRLCQNCGKAMLPDPVLRGPEASAVPLLTGNARWDAVVGVGIALGTGVAFGGVGYLITVFPSLSFLYSLVYGLGWIPVLIILMGIYYYLRDRYPIVARAFRIAALLLYIAAPICGLLGAFALCLYQLGRTN